MPPATIPSRDRLIVALDVPSVDSAESVIAKLGDSVTFYKIGYQLGFAGGLPLARRLTEAGRSSSISSCTTSATRSPVALRASHRSAGHSSRCTPIRRP